jgi:hypothetical protein
MDRVTLETKLDKKEYRAISYWNAFCKTPTLIILSVLCVAIGGLNLLLNPQGVMLYLSLVLVLYPVLLIGVLSFGIYRMNKSHDVEKATHARYTVSAEGIETELLQREGHAVTGWGEIYRAYENRRYFILFVNRSQLIAMKKEQLPEGGEQALREILKENLGKRCKIR